MTDDQRFEDAVREFADTIAANFALPVVAQPEDQLKAPVRELLRICGEAWGIETASRSEARAEGDIGRPDLGVTAGGLLCGYVELKAPGRGARPERFRGRDREQWQRFQALPNLIYTDGSEWSLYRDGQLPPVARVRIADDVSAEGASGLDAAAIPKLAGLLRDFLMHEPVTPNTARGLAEFLAPLARLLRDEVREALDREGSAARKIADELRGVLFVQADDDQIADACAQTLTYALLLARFEGAQSLTRAFAVNALREGEHDLLATALDLMETGRDELSLPIDLLERAIGVVDASVLLGRHGRQLAFIPAQEVDDDPWLYFYEDFLGAYDAALRKNRGVHFTPVAVVRAQVRFAAELLRKRFGKQMAFADDGIVVLDPACGTATYPLAVLEHATETVRETLGPGAVPERLRDLAGRLHAFEILVGPYAVAKLRLTQRLLAEGVTDRNPLVYLADTLESPNVPPEVPFSVFNEPLTAEHERARRVKQETRIFVCLGNPPYDREQREPSDDAGQQRKGGWVRRGDKGPDAEPPILEDFLAPVREAGGGVHLKGLYNDYVYFWRWALWKVFDSTEGAGIVTFITASPYLRGQAFPGMRRKMREVFDELWIIDLGGDSLGTRKSENVFAIQIPVAIAIGVRSGEPDQSRPARVHRVRLTGTAAEKLGTLDAASELADLDWRECVSGWAAPFQVAGDGAYFDWPKVTDVFPWQHTGSQLKRTWPIGATRGVLAQRWRALLEHSSDDRRTMFRETRDRKTDREYPALLPDDRAVAIATLGSDAPTPRIERYAFRSFDRQWVVADARVGDFMRPDLWRAAGPEQAYMVSLLTGILGEGAAAIAAATVPDVHFLRGSYGDKGVIPLYRDAEATEPNVTGGLREGIAEVHGADVTAKRLFAYAYGLLAHPAYVDRFWEELEQPPPRLPITKDASLFGRVSDLGERLLNLHTYGERFRGPGRGDTPPGEARCTKEVPPVPLPEGHSYDAETRTLHVGDGEFAPVSREVYGYSVSGFHVVKSWLDRRKLKRSGRSSSPLDAIRPERWEFAEELLQLLRVLEETIRLQPDGAALLDEVCASELFTADELPTPTDAERQPPGAARQASLRL